MSTRVLIIYGSPQAVCGVGTWTEALCRALDTGGYDVTVGLVKGVTHHRPEEIEQFRPGMKTVHLDVRTGTEEGRIQAVTRAIRDTGAGLVIVGSGGAVFEGIRRVKWAGRRLKFIAVNHGNLPHHAACLVENRDVLDGVVCVSELTRRTLNRLAESHEIDPARITRIPHGVKVPEKSAPRPEGPPRIGFAGQLGDHKRAGDLVPFSETLMREHPIAELWIAGDGPWMETLTALRDKAPERIRLFGRLTAGKLHRDFYPQLDIITLFSESESFAYALAEGMAHGAVPVTSAFHGIRFDGLVLSGETGRVFPIGDTAEAVRQVCALLADEDKRRAMAARCREHVAASFSEQAFASCWLDFIAQVMDQPAATPEFPDSLRARGRLGLPERFIETARRRLHRYPAHQYPREEWPLYRCRRDDLREEAGRALHELMEAESCAG